jgi:hypothetical protein
MILHNIIKTLKNFVKSCIPIEESIAILKQQEIIVRKMLEDLEVKRESCENNSYIPGEVYEQPNLTRQLVHYTA